MLIYQGEGLLEAEPKNIKQLCRSSAPLSLGNREKDAFEVQAVLCVFLSDDEQRCLVAFYSKSLKRALLFAVEEAEENNQWQCGLKALAQLGFDLEDVTLEHKPAMLEVVLRNVPGLVSPTDAAKQRTEKSDLLANLRNVYEKNPDSAQGKKAALTLNEEERLLKRSQQLRGILEGLLTPPDETGDADLETLQGQLRELTSRLEAAEALADSERQQRQASEAITSAAEKRIQELEATLVDVETKTSDTTKANRQLLALREQVNKLEGQLETAAAELAEERGKQQQLIDEVKHAREQAAALEQDGAGSEPVLDDIRKQLVEEQAARKSLDASLREAELRNRALDKELGKAVKKAAQYDDAVKEADSLQSQLDKVQESWQQEIASRETLEKQLIVVEQKNKTLAEGLQDAEKAVEEQQQVEERAASLAKEKDRLANELESLSEQSEQDSAAHKQLQKALTEGAKRIKALEASLAEANEKVQQQSEQEKATDEAISERESLRSAFEELEEQLQAVEKQLAKEQLEQQKLAKAVAVAEKALAEREQAEAASLIDEEVAQAEGNKVKELEEQLQAVEKQLAKEQLEQQKLAEAVTEAEKKLAEQETLLTQAVASQKERKAVTPAADADGPGTVKKAASAKPLPHELRPAPKPGVFFHPDWDLNGLPCQSIDQVYRAWEAAFNVQLSLEGYPSQYCMAFLVVLRLDKQKKLYLLYRLKQSKHILLCVPAKVPRDEAGLKKAIAEGLGFLKRSGFEMEEMSKEHIDSVLKGLIQEA